MRHAKSQKESQIHCPFALLPYFGGFLGRAISLARNGFATVRVNIVCFSCEKGFKAIIRMKWLKTKQKRWDALIPPPCESTMGKQKGQRQQPRIQIFN